MLPAREARHRSPRRAPGCCSEIVFDREERFYLAIGAGLWRAGSRRFWVSACGSERLRARGCWPPAPLCVGRSARGRLPSGMGSLATTRRRRLRTDLAEVVVLPVPVVVQPGEAEAATLVVVFAALVDPGDMLRFLAATALRTVGFAGVRTVFPFHGRIRGDRAEDRRDALHALAEAHVEIPLVIRLEFFDPVGGLVFREHLELGDPVRG